MRRLIGPLFLLAIVASYLHYVQGWDFARVRREPAVTFFFPEDASATSTPVGQRGTGTHWETVKPMPSPRTAFGAAVAGNTIYVVGGFDGYYRTLSSAMAYDIGADAWRQIPRLPQALHHPSVASDGEKIYVIGGLTGLSSRPIDDVFVFDPAKGAWALYGRLGEFRGGGAAASVDGILHVVGGRTTAGVSAEMEYFDPERGWNGRASMSTPRTYLAAAATDGKLYALGGREGSVAMNLGTLETYDPESQKWETLPDMPTPRSGHGAAGIAGKIYAVGGETKDGTVAAVEAFDVKTKTWSTLAAPMLSPRHGLVVVAWKDRVYAIGGGRRAGFSVSDLNEVLILADAKE